MANNVNPFTGRTSQFDLETPNGYIYFDDEDGLLWGDVQLRPGVDADALFVQLVGKARPTTYRSYLANLKKPVDGDAAGTDQTEAGSAHDVLDDETFAQVVVTNAKALDVAALLGIPGSVSAESVELSSRANDPVNPRPSVDQVNLGTLGVGASKPQSTAPDVDVNGNTPETAAARSKADAFASGQSSGIAPADVSDALAEADAKVAEADNKAADATDAQKAAEDAQAQAEQAAADALSAQQQAEETAKQAQQDAADAQSRADEAVRVSAELQSQIDALEEKAESELAQAATDKAAADKAEADAAAAMTQAVQDKADADAKKSGK